MITRFILRLVALVFMSFSLICTAMFALRPPQPDTLLGLMRYTGGSGFIVRDVGRGLSFRYWQQLGLFSWSASPDGRWFVLNVVIAARPYEARLYAPESHFRDTPTVTYSSLFAADWSPDGRYLLLSSPNTPWFSVAAPDIPSTPFLLSNARGSPLWSPDSTTLYFIDNGGNIAYLPARCFEPQALCVPTALALDEPEHIVAALAGWMPNGRDMMVIAESPYDRAFGLYALDLADGSLHLVQEDVLPGARPVWSPDGETLAAVLAIPGSATPPAQSQPIPGVYLIDRQTRERALLWTGVAGSLNWSPNGRYLAFELLARVGNDRSVWLYDRETEQLTPLTPTGEFEASPGWFRYTGKPFEAGYLLAVATAMFGVLWLTRQGERARK